MCYKHPTPGGQESNLFNDFDEYTADLSKSSVRSKLDGSTAVSRTVHELNGRNENDATATLHSADAGTRLPRRRAVRAKPQRAPGADAHWLSAAKNGFGTSNTTRSKVWFTLTDGVLSEVYYPTLDVPNVQSCSCLSSLTRWRLKATILSIVRKFRIRGRLPFGKLTRRRVVITPSPRRTSLILSDRPY